MHTTHLLARAVIREDNRILVVQADGQPHTFLPGGHLEAGEGLEGGLSRELDEELGVEATVERYLGAVEHTWRRNGERQYEINHCFAVTVPALSAPSAPSAQEEYLTFCWVPVSRLDAVHLKPAPLQALLAGGADAESPWWASTLTAASHSSTHAA